MPVQSSIFLAPAWREEHLGQQRASHTSQSLQPIPPTSSLIMDCRVFQGKQTLNFPLGNAKSTGKVRDNTALDRGSALRTPESPTTLRVHKDQSET